MKLYFASKQTARPALYDIQLVNQMITDVEKVDLYYNGSQAIYTNFDGEPDLELNSECMLTF